MQTRSHEPMFGGARGLSLALALAAGWGACDLERGGTSAIDPSEAPAEPDLDAGIGEPPSQADSALADAGREAGATLQPPVDGGITRPSPGSPLEPDAARPSEADGGGTEAGMPPAPESCRLEGAFSADVSFDVEWEGTSLASVVPLLRRGVGELRIIVRLDLRGDSASRARSLITACGSSLPDFAAGNPLVAGERYAAYIPSPAWDQPTMPRWDLGWVLACRSPGCAMTSETVVATFGARAAAQDVWPGRSGSTSQLVVVDHDDDGLAGITFLARGSDERDASGVPYAQLPVSATLAERATKVLLAFQIAGDFQGQIDDCDALSGRVLSGRVESRAVGCSTRAVDQASEELPCSEDEAAFTDQALPTWRVTGGTFRARRVAADASCATIRAVWE